MSYTLQGDALNIDHIRRDIAVLQELEKAAVAAGRPPASPLGFDEEISFATFKAFVVQASFPKRMARQTWRCLKNFFIAYKVDAGMDDDRCYMGSLCHKALLVPSDLTGKTRLETFPRWGEISMDILDAFVVYKRHEPGSTPDDWKPRR